MIILFWMMLLAYLLPRFVFYQRIQNNDAKMGIRVKILSFQFVLMAIFSMVVNTVGNGYCWLVLIFPLLFISALSLWLVQTLNTQENKAQWATLVNVVSLLGYSLYLYIMLAIVSSAINEQALVNSLSSIITLCKFDKLIHAKTLIKIAIVLCGLFISTNEVNIILKWILNATNIKDPKSTGEDESYPNAGLLIGFLERTVVYLSIIFGYTNAIGVVLVLKSVTRFKELDTRKYAEYMLIGTLLSFIFASLIALFIKHYLKGL